MNAETDLTKKIGDLHQVFYIAKIEQNNYRTWTYTFDHGMPCTPGQFVMMWLPGHGEKPFSIAWDDPLQLTIASIGPFTDAIQRLKVGDPLWVRGPIGKGYRLSGKHIVMAGRGYGAAPLLFLANRALASGIEVDVCLGARLAKRLLLVDEFKQLGVRVHISTYDGSAGEQGMVTMHIERILQDPNTRPDGGVYACGPVKTLVWIDELCEKYGVPRQLSWEAHMRCGMGVCGSCEIALPNSEGDLNRSAWLVCMDGPVSFSK